MIALNWTSRAAIALALWAATAASACSPSRGAGSLIDAGSANEWSVLDLPTRTNLWAIHGVGTDLYLAGDDGTILRTADAARTWVDVSVAPASVGATIQSYPSFHSIGASAADDVWVAGIASFTSGVLMHTIDRGQSWQRVDVGTSSVLNGVWPIDRDRVLVTTGDGQILGTTDGGAHWTAVFSDPRMVLFGCWGSASNDLYVVGGVATASDGDAGANPSDGGMAPDGGANTTTTYPGVVLHSSDAGVSWQTVADAATACLLWHVSGTPDGATVYVAGNCGSVAHTTDHGASWSRSGTAAVGYDDFEISDVWVSPTGTSYLLEDGSGFNPATPADQHVCRAIDVEPFIMGTAGCERLPPSGGFSASPAGVWGTADDDVWIVSSSSILWHRS
jgi:photosystem II stability/assembly factor-like uncharacterized protein